MTDASTMSTMSVDEGGDREPSDPAADTELAVAAARAEPAASARPADPADPAAPTEPAAPEVPLLREPADGVPEPITTVEQLRAAIAGLAAGHGPLAVDAERASGYRYSQRAYLVQLRRDGYGTALIDPIAVPDLSELNDALGDVEWILHAAHQDLPCLAEIGLVPRRLFDTELAGRLLGEERVALGTMVEYYLGVRLEKGHSAADWSTRPLPFDWLVYAALDVELLVPLRDALAAELASAGKTEWAAQEFEAARIAPPPAPRIDPWRRTSGIHAVRNRRQLAAIRSLWRARDEYAAQRDIAPGRILPDAAIIDAARRNPQTVGGLVSLSIFGGSRQRRNATRWLDALQSAQALTDDELPPATGPSSDLIPPAGRWRERSPEAAARLAACRDVIAVLAAEHTVLAQNLLASDVVRRLTWQPPEPINIESVRVRLESLGARQWQIELTAAALTTALLLPVPPVPPVPSTTPSTTTPAAAAD
jgi:ribonuclease D